jgi:regulatory protein
MRGKAPDPDEFETLSATAPQKKGPSLKARAIGLLSRREHSRLELARKLAPHAGTPDQLEALLNELEQGKWLSNERFAHSLVHRRAALQGAARIVQELKQHGLADNQIGELRQQLQGTEFERAQAVWQKKFGQAPDNAKEYARQFRFLASRGFSSDCLRRILGEFDGDAG